MTGDRPPTIFGWRPTGRAIVALGVFIAIGSGLASLSKRNIPGAMFSNPITVRVIALTLVLVVTSGIARSIWRRQRPTPKTTDSVLEIVLLKLANLVAILLLGAALLVLLALRDPHWQNLLEAMVLCTLVAVALSLIQAIIANLVAFRRPRRPPPAAPPA